MAFMSGMDKIVVALEDRNHVREINVRVGNGKSGPKVSRDCPARARGRQNNRSAAQPAECFRVRGLEPTDLSVKTEGSLMPRDSYSVIVTISDWNEEGESVFAPQHLSDVTVKLTFNPRGQIADYSRIYQGVFLVCASLALLPSYGLSSQ